jgi:hypothetical protein
MEGLLEEDNLPTPDDERELVEKVARVIELRCEPECPDCPCIKVAESKARAAIAVVLEEAAKVADNHNAFSLSGDPWKYPTEIAAAIRAINPKER